MPILPEQDTVEFVNQVNRYVAKNADKGIKYNPLCDTFYKIPFEDFEVDTFFTIFKRNEGIATCGLSARLMAKILWENGIKAYTYNFGFDKINSHVVVLVKLNGTLKAYDPFMSSYLKDPDGYDFLRHLEAIKNSEPKSYEIVTDTVIADLVIGGEELRMIEGLDLPDSCKQNLGIRSIKDHIPVGTDIYAFKLYWGYSYFGCQSFRENFEKKLHEETNFKNFYDALIFKMGKVEGSEDCEEINSLIDSILAS